LAKKETGLFKQFTPPAALKIPQETLNSVLNLKTGETAPMVKIDKTYYVFSLKEKKPGRVPELAEVKERIKEIIIREESRKTAQDKIKACADELKNNKPFNRSAKAGGLKVKETKFFKSTDKIEGLGQAKLFWDTANKLKPEQASEVFSDANGYYIIKLKAINPVDEEKFAKDKSGLTENMLNQEKNKAFGKFIEETRKKAEK
jgi:parvulin-like peptidyl-prolyl isomerase